MRRVLAILSVAMVSAGAVILADAALTLAWKEPVSAIYAQIQQGAAQGELDDLTESFFADPEVGAAETAGGDVDPVRRARRLAGLFEDELDTGQGIGKVSVPSAGIDYVVVEGTDTGTLQKGPGRYPETSLPGQGSTVGIAGHRTTYGAPFRKINKIDDGDTIEVEMPYATFVYRVKRSEIVEPTDTHIVDDTGSERLVLTACHPLYSAAQRYAVFADLEEVVLAERA